MPQRVIVDENAGPGTALWDAFQQTCRNDSHEYVFLATAHRGIPDVEILDKLLPSGTVLLTGDCVLHMRALKQGCSSYTLNQQGQLTRKRLPYVRMLKSLPKSVHATLLDDYRQHPVHNLASQLKTDLTERQFKRYRTARRRIRSHFGSAAAMSQVSVTVGSMMSSGGLLCGFVFHVAGNSGVKGLRANEGYCRSHRLPPDAACPVLHALRNQYLLQLDQVRTDLFIIPPASLELMRKLANSDQPVSTPVHEATRQLLRGLSNLALHPCVKGPFHDAMQAMLGRHLRTGGRQTRTLDFAKIATSFLAAEDAESPSSFT